MRRQDEISCVDPGCRGLKAQDFLAPDGKHIVPTERGLALFGVLERADPALVDPGVTAQLELLLDEVLVGTQEMAGAVDAVCAQALRIIDRLTDGVGAQTLPPMDEVPFPGKTAEGKADGKELPWFHHWTTGPVAQLSCRAVRRGPIMRGPCKACRTALLRD